RRSGLARGAERAPLRAGLRPGLQHHRSLRRPAAPEAAARSHRDRARTRLPHRRSRMNPRRRLPDGWRGSLRLRLLIGTLAWIIATIAVAGWGLSSLFGQHLSRQFQAELATHLDQLAAMLAFDAQGRPTVTGELSDP